MQWGKIVRLALLLPVLPVLAELENGGEDPTADVYVSQQRLQELESFEAASELRRAATSECLRVGVVWPPGSSVIPWVTVQTDIRGYPVEASGATLATALKSFSIHHPSSWKSLSEDFRNLAQAAWEADEGIHSSTDGEG